MKLAKLFISDGENVKFTRTFYLDDAASVTDLVGAVENITDATVYRAETVTNWDNTTTTSTEHSDVERKGVLRFGTAGRSTMQVSIPAIDQFYLDPLSDNMMREGPFDELYNFVMSNGRTRHGQPVTHLISAKEAYGKKRN